MSTVQRFCCDDETGEIITYPISRETGEPYMESSSSVQVPSPPTKKRKCKDKTKKHIRFRKGYSTNSKKFHNLKANIIAGSNVISHRLLLIPTLMIFPGLFIIILMVLEIFLHVRCHRKNKRLEDPRLYYRSPFHVVTSTFCGVCRESESASKVGLMQDKRRCRYDYLRGIVLWKGNNFVFCVPKISHRCWTD